MISLKQHLFGNTQDSASLDALLAPSWLSGLVSVLISLGIVFGAVVTLHYSSSSFHILSQLRDSSTKPVSTNYDTLGNNFSSDTLVSDIPLFIFWAGVGLIVYSLTTALLNSLHQAVEFEQEMNYVNANRQAMRRHAIERFALRAMTLLVWFLYLKVTLHILIPYAIAVAYAGTGAASLRVGAGYTVWALSLMLVIVHIHVILLRLLFLKPRLFGNT